MKGIAQVLAAAAAGAIVFGAAAGTAQAATMVEVGPQGATAIEGAADGADWPSGGSIVAGAYKK